MHIYVLRIYFRFVKQKDLVTIHRKKKKSSRYSLCASEREPVWWNNRVEAFRSSTIPFLAHRRKRPNSCERKCLFALKILRAKARTENEWVALSSLMAYKKSFILFHSYILCIYFFFLYRWRNMTAMYLIYRYIYLSFFFIFSNVFTLCVTEMMIKFKLRKKEIVFSLSFNNFFLLEIGFFEWRIYFIELFV